MTWTGHPRVRENHDDWGGELDLPWWAPMVILVVAGPLALITSVAVWIAERVRQWR